jgi:hypothetical protein
MKPAKHMTDDELKYADRDLREAIAVTEPGRFSNMDRYLADYRAVAAEIDARARKRMLRRWIAEAPGEILTPVMRHYGPRLRTRNSWNDYRTKQARSAMFTLYWRGR